MAIYDIEVNWKTADGGYDILHPITTDDNILLSEDTSGNFSGNTLADAINELKQSIGSSGGSSEVANIAIKLQTARTILTNLSSSTAQGFDGTSNITPGVTGVLPIANGGTGATTSAQALSNLGGLSTSGTAASATKLATSRTIRTNLNSTSTASFNGTANVTPGVTGTLPVTNGGTGVTSMSSLASALINTGQFSSSEGKFGTITRNGTGSTTIALNFGFKPKFVMYLSSKGTPSFFIFGEGYKYKDNVQYAVLTQESGTDAVYPYSLGTNPTFTSTGVTIYLNGSDSGPISTVNFNNSNYPYFAVAWG